MKMGEKVVSKRDANYCCTFVNYFIAKFNTLPVFLYFISRSMFAKLNEMKIKSRIDQCNWIRVWALVAQFPFLWLALHNDHSDDECT